MNNVFFGRIEKGEDFDNKQFVSEEENFNSIDIGDLAFICPQNPKGVKGNPENIKYLWKATKWEKLANNKKKLKFELIHTFNPGLQHAKDFICLKLFKLDIVLLNAVMKPQIGCFKKLQLTQGAFDIINNINKLLKYIGDKENYRKIIIHKSKDDIVKNSKDVQLYMDNGKYCLAKADFIDDDIYKKFDGDKLENAKYAGSTSGKYKFYRTLTSGKTEISRHDDTIANFYDVFMTENNSAVGKRTEFIDWLKQTGTVKRISNYTTGIKDIEETFEVDVDDEYAKDEECKDLKNRIDKEPDVIEGKNNKKINKNNWVSYLNKYIEFKKSTSNLENNDTNNKNTISAELEQYLSSNTIFYGVPGSGKSYKINQLLGIGKSFEKNGNELDSKYYKRILFYPEYTYSEFIGQIMPETNGDKIEYKFKAGPFVKILKDALSNKNNNYYLIIEEINRGDAPAIFGDIFQLLDRDDNGQSEYSIDNEQIVKWLKDNKVDVDKIYIPSNLTILATMNTSDQNVFTIDTAFKRRWRMTRIKNNFSSKDEFLDTKINNKYTWREFAKALNDDIIQNCNDGAIAEDKLLGTHFVKKAEIQNIQIFAEKIFMYLWNDVVKYNKEQLFRQDIKTLDDLIEKFIKNENVFNSRCSNMEDLYNKDSQQENN